MGYAILGLLLVAAVAVIAATMVFDWTMGTALLVLLVLDAIIVVGGWRLAKRAAAADKRQGR